MSELLGFDLPAGMGEPEPQTALPFEETTPEVVSPLESKDDPSE
jgi:hypothetical protein